MNFEKQQFEESKNKEELEEKVRTEYKESQEQFSELIDLVNQRYEAPDSALAGSPEQLKTFKEHNEQVLKLCIKRGIEKNLDKKELKILEVSAILHDLNKADKPEGEIGRITNYTLAAHGEMALNEVENIINKHSEVLDNILGKDYHEQEKERVIAAIKNAIKSHMGPHPGFMDRVLKRVNQKLEKIGEPKIEHPYPKQGDQVAETLLAADMCSLASRKGREKILAIHSAVPCFKKQDKELCERYKEFGIDLTLGQAVLLSGFDSAEQARDMIKNSDDKEWINKVIEDSKKQDYTYKDQKVNYEQAITKRERFNQAKRLKEVREKLNNE